MVTDKESFWTWKVEKDLWAVTGGSNWRGGVSKGQKVSGSSYGEERTSETTGGVPSPGERGTLGCQDPHTEKGRK